MHSGAALLERRAAMASATVNSARVVMTTVTCPRGLHAVRPRGPVPLGGLVVRRTTPGPGAAMRTVYAAPTYGEIMFVLCDIFPNTSALALASQNSLLKIRLYTKIFLFLILRNMTILNN